MKKAIRRGIYLIMSELKDHKNELVSIIVPVYNQERYLEECVQSIQKQTYRNLEIILVDDGSTDKSGAICEKLSESDKRIIVIHKQNGGVSAARYDGVMNSHGDWIMFVDNDDLVSPYMIDSFSHFFEHEEIDIITGGAYGVAEHKELPEWLDFDGAYDIYSGKEICSNLWKSNREKIVTPLWGKVYRKSFLSQINLEKYREICPTIFLEDVLKTPIFYNAAKKVCVVEGIYYWHREVANSISVSMKLGSFFYEQVDSGEILLNFYRKLSMKEMYDWQLDNFYRTILRLYCLVDYENETKQFKDNLKLKCVTYYNKYYWDYMRAKRIRLWRKIFMLCFRFNHSLWANMVCKLYYKK